jgi:hypothetical protein
MIKEVILDRLRERSGDPSMFQDIRFGVRPVHRPIADEPTSAAPDRAGKSALTIREIAETRLKKWADEDRA